MAQINKLPMRELGNYLQIGLKTDPYDLELIWNIAVWLHQLGDDKNSKATFAFASQLAPHNPIVAGALSQFTQENTNGR